MIVTTEYVDIPSGGSPMRMFVATPTETARRPDALCHRDTMLNPDPGAHG